ncbi:MAG: histidine--tRNA ligase [Victivallaceae bacterium]|nr:histidine--tRNA ligase [Victivallaceae bacterium]MDD4317463.1 histidine--tRNA ligase [Victivallaceae bacterium]
MANFSPPPGTADIFPEEAAWWQRLEQTAFNIFPLYGFGELRTPIFEFTDVFKRGIGDETEVVQKEMYTFEDRGGRSLTLRPEGTAGVMRALLNTDVMNGNEKRVYYCGPMFRGERPAAGRRRQFHQIGVENVGTVSPEADAETISALVQYINALGITGFRLLINTRGIAADRAPAEAALNQFFSSKIDGMCQDCRARLGRNIWRILDCKQDGCREIVRQAPNYVSHYTEESRNYFSRVCSLLDRAGIAYEIDPFLVRGLDYYVHTVFEIVHTAGLGAQAAIAAGGRYELFLPEARKPICGVGFAAGMERLLLVQQALGVAPPEAVFPPIFMVSMGHAAREANIELAATLRCSGLPVIVEFEDKSMKAQMRAANRAGSRFVVIRGDNELEREVAICKDMNDSSQIEMSVMALESFLKDKHKESMGENV